MGVYNLTELIHGLKVGETQLIRNYYKSVPKLKDNTKRLKLFELIKKNKFMSDAEACKELYNAPLNNTFSQLKKRLRDDILNILLLQDSKSRFNTPYARAEFDTRRKIIEGDILISRGITKEGIKTLKDALKIAEQYELYNESIMGFSLLLESLTLIKGEKAYINYKSEIEKNLRNLEAHLKAKTYYHKIIAPSLFKLKDQDDYIKFAEKATNELKEDYKATKSNKIGYYYYYIATLYYNLSKNYKEALGFAEKFLEINNKSKAVSSKRTIASAYLQLSYINLQLQNYNKAILNAENAIKNFKSGLLNELTTLELLFLSHFYNKNVIKANETLEKALVHPKLNSNKFLPAKWHYYKSCFLFQQGMFDEANAAMNNCSYLLEDKTGWLYGYRILDIMITLECNELFLVDGKVANFKKIIGKQKEINSSRAKTTLKILDALVRKHYDYNLAVKSQNANLIVLSEGRNNHLWEPMGYELIRFEEWFLNKLSRKKKS